MSIPSLAGLVGQCVELCPPCLLRSASAWGHIAVGIFWYFFDRPIIDPNPTPCQIVQLLIERGCQYAARNNEGFTASDYAYSSVFYFATAIRLRRHLI